MILHVAAVSHRMFYSVCEPSKQPLFVTVRWRGRREAGRQNRDTDTKTDEHKGSDKHQPAKQRRRRGRRIKTFWRPRESEIRGEAEWQKCCIPSITQRLNSLHVLHVRSGCRSMVNNENSSLVCLFVLWLVAGWWNQYASQSKLQGLLFFMNYLEFQTCRGGQIRSDPGRKKEREREKKCRLFFYNHHLTVIMFV